MHMHRRASTGLRDAVGPSALAFGSSSHAGEGEQLTLTVVDVAIPPLQQHVDRATARAEVLPRVGPTGYGAHREPRRVEPWRDLFPYLLVVAASSFVYIAVADLLPQLQRRLRLRDTLAQLAWLAIGLLSVVLIGTVTR